MPSSTNTTSNSSTTTPSHRINSPAWNHLHTLLPQLISLLFCNPTMTLKSDSERSNPTHPPDNVHFMWLFAKATLRQLQKIPPDLPVSHDKEWDEVVQRCEWIDGMINDDTGDLDAVTGQYPGQTEFGREEKECAKLLAIGLQELLVEI